MSDRTDSVTFDLLLVDSKMAATMCGVGRSTWLSWDSAGLNPAPVRINGRVLWCVQHLRAWAAAGCPSRAEMAGIEGGDHAR